MNVPDLSLSVAEALLRSHTPDERAALAGRSATKKLPFTITISREVGALGNTVAAVVGEKLGWPVYDQELIHKVADELHKPSFAVRGVDEKSFNWLEDTLSGLFSEHHVNPSSYLKHLLTTLHGLALLGHCVIVGRGSNFVLPKGSTLRVRLVANLPDRVRIIGRVMGISDREASVWIEKKERERTQFIEKNFGVNVADPHHYHLVLNTSYLTVEECAGIIVELLHELEKHREAEQFAETVAAP